MRIAIVQGGAWGDNINSTLMLRPILDKYPNCTIDVHTSTKYGNAFDNNPYITNIIRHQTHDKNSSIDIARTLPTSISSKYDIVVAPHPMFRPGKWNSVKNPHLGENLILSWVRQLEELEIEYNEIETVLRLTDSEKEIADQFITTLPNNKNVLMEIHGESGQTFWDHNWTITVGEYFCKKGYNLLISNLDNRADIKHLTTRYNNAKWVGGYTIRQCAQIFNYCHIFISVSSGLSNACNTNWCKKDIKWFEVVNSLPCSSCVLRSDGKIFWHENNHNRFIQMLESNDV